MNASRSALSPRDFRALFDDSIRVALNYGRFERERWPVTVDVVTDHEALGALRVPWRHDSRDVEKVEHVPYGGKRHTVASAAAALHAMPEPRRRGVVDEARRLIDGYAARRCSSRGRAASLRSRDLRRAVRGRVPRRLVGDRMNERDHALLAVALERLQPLREDLVASGWQPEIIVFTNDEITRIPGYKVALVVPLDSVSE